MSDRQRVPERPAARVDRTSVASPEEELETVRAVRRHVLKGAAWAVPLFGGSWALLGDAFWRNPVLIALWASGVVLMVRQFLRPLDHTAVLRRSRLPDVLAAGGLPERPDLPPLSDWDRRLALLELMDELGPPRTGLFAAGAGRFVARWAGGIGTVAWSAVAVAAATQGEWGATAVAALAALGFGAAARAARRARARQSDALGLLQRQLDALYDGRGRV